MYIPILYELETIIRVILKIPRKKDVNIGGKEYWLEKKGKIEEPYAMIDFTDAAHRFNTGGPLSRKIELNNIGNVPIIYFQSDVIQRYILYLNLYQYDFTRGMRRPLVDDEARELGVIEIESQEVET